MKLVKIGVGVALFLALVAGAAERSEGVWFMTKLETSHSASRPDQMPATEGAPSRLAQSQTNRCLTCCSERQVACFKSEGGRGGQCEVNYTNCVANCNSRGETPSNWVCWR